jgi:hypothetical protein
MALTVSRALRLPDAQHFPAGETKTGIAIHHTVGGSARSTYEWWLSDRQMVGTAYVIDRDGTVEEVFDPSAWAWQFGLKWPNARRIAFEKRFIGIEIASEGGLIESDGSLYCFDRVSERTRKARDGAFDFGQTYRGYRWFDQYEPAQVDALVGLIDELCDRFHIPRQTPSRFFDYYGEALAKFEGIIGHTHVRLDKSDPLPDRALWDRIIADCRVQPVDVAADGTIATRTVSAAPTVTATTASTTSSLSGNGTARAQLDAPAIEALFEENIQQIHRMNVAAGSMVKGLIMELERAGRNTYIRLFDAQRDGHVVHYEFVQGDRSLVGRLARSLGFAEVTDSRLEVRHA